LLALCFSTLLFAQEKVEAPVWNVGDKWVFSNKGTIEVIRTDQNSYVLKFSDDICAVESQKFNAIMFEKQTLYKVYGFKGDERKVYTNQLRKIFNFPLSPGKKWEDRKIVQKSISSAFSDLGDVTYFEIFEVLGWEDIKVQAGKFKAIKLGVTRGEPPPAPMWGTSLYWYSPDVKYFVKCQYSPSSPFDSWELTAFTVKK
jgi:hypothetical protein